MSHPSPLKTHERPSAASQPSSIGVLRCSRHSRDAVLGYSSSHCLGVAKSQLQIDTAVSRYFRPLMQGFVNCRESLRRARKDTHLPTPNDHHACTTTMKNIKIVRHWVIAYWESRRERRWRLSALHSRHHHQLRSFPPLPVCSPIHTKTQASSLSALRSRKATRAQNAHSCRK